LKERKKEIIYLENSLSKLLFQKKIRVLSERDSEKLGISAARMARHIFASPTTP
jgi:hypothetical protein